MANERLPLLSHPDPAQPFVWHRGEAVTVGEFLCQAQALADELPQCDYAINLCEDRYHFLLAFVAMLLRRQVNLLPANRSSGEVSSVSARYGDCPCLVDEVQGELSLPQHTIAPQAQGSGAAEIPQLDPQQRCAVVFTSGSTGESVPWEKRWGELYLGAQLTMQRLAIEGATVVATVPPQHMFGLETTVLLPLVAGLAVESGRPFFPSDLRDTLNSVPAPHLLITTPVHLRACLDAGLEWPPVARIVSATAPLAQELAAEAEVQFAATLQEIYGSTETGAVATRRTSREDEWLLHCGVTLEQQNGQAVLQGGHLCDSVALNDRVQPKDGGRFVLLGRNSDMVKIAGKRVSLSDLNHRLLAIPGVEDGVFVEGAERDGAVSRLAAVVAAPTLEDRAILEALKPQLDPVCLPRPIYRVERLPRNEAGKLPRKALQQLLQELRSR